MFIQTQIYIYIYMITNALIIPPFLVEVGSVLTCYIA